MDWKRLEETTGLLCTQCHRTIRAGQVAVFQNLGPQHPITHRKLWWHAACVNAVMEVCPPDNDQQEFNDLRDRIAATGLAFPD